eukprot:scaffold3289_cov122-Alexandrium_tamarense.AAC.1
MNDTHAPLIETHASSLDVLVNPFAVDVIAVICRITQDGSLSVHSPYAAAASGFCCLTLNDHTDVSYRGRGGGSYARTASIVQSLQCFFYNQKEEVHRRHAIVCGAMGVNTSRGYCVGGG